MVKVIRKYNQYILVVGGVLLMIAFLMPNAISELRGDPMKAVVAHVGEDGIRQRELFDADMSFRAVKHIMPNFVGGAIGTPIVDGTHWFLLVREARAGGFVGGEQDGKDWELPKVMVAQQLAAQELKEMASFYWQQSPQARDHYIKLAEQYMPGVIGSAVHESRLTPDQVYMALAEARGIERMRVAYEDAARFSDKRTLVDAARRFDVAEFDALVIGADVFTHAMPEPTPEQMEAQFEKYKNTKPGAGESGIGYLLPARVKLEYLTLDRAKIAESIEIDPIEVRKRQTVDRAKDPEGFAKERDHVTAQLREERVGRIMIDADEAIKAEVQRVLRKLPTQSGYHVLPDDWAEKRPSFEAVAQAAVEQVKQRSGVTIPLPTVTVRAADWLTARDLGQLPGIGSSQVRIGTRTFAFPQMAVEVKELTGRTDAQLADVALQMNVPFVELPVVDAAGNRYYFTILDAKGESSAASVDEVKAQLITDFKRLAAYDKLKGEAANYMQVAAKDGLAGVAKLVNDQLPKQPDGSTLGSVEPLTHMSLSRFITIQPQSSALDEQSVRDAVMAMADKLDPVKPATDLPIEQRLASVDVPKYTSLVLAQLTGHRPLTQEAWLSSQSAAARALAQDELRAALPSAPTNPFEFEQIKTRENYRSDRDTSGDKKPGETDSKES